MYWSYKILIKIRLSVVKQSYSNCGQRQHSVAINISK